MTHPTVAGSHFGNKEEITVTLNSPVKPVSPAKPDFTSNGKVFDKVDFGNGEVKASKSVKIGLHPGNHPKKSIFVESDKDGTFDIEVVLDESELVGGILVWRKMPGAAGLSATAGVLQLKTFEALVSQIRVKFTNGADPAVVNAWVMSNP